MKPFAEKRVVVFALVTYEFQEYKVWPNGKVEKWAELDGNGFWKDLDSYENEFEEVREAGLEVLK